MPDWNRHRSAQPSTLRGTVKWVPAKGRWCSAAGKVTAGLAESNGSLPPGRWLKSLAGWLHVHRNQLRAQRSVTSMGSLYLFPYWNRRTSQGDISEMVQDKNVVTTDHHMNYVTACTVVQAAVKATIHSNRKDQILTPWGSETLEHISMKLKIYNNQILHSHKDHQILFVGGPNTSKTNPRWRTATILKNRKSAISPQRFDRSPRNLVRWRKLGLRTGPEVKISNI